MTRCSACTRGSPCKALAAAVFAVTLLGGCLTTGGAPQSPAQPEGSHEMLDATLWQQSSAEYDALARQIFLLARLRLAEGLEDPDWRAAPEQVSDAASLPPAIILDLDETVLDNTRYEARIVLDYGSYSFDTFKAWCEQASAPAVPGVVDFLDYAAQRGVEIFYYSSRLESLRQCTQRNLLVLGLPAAGQPDHLLLNDGTSKAEFRQRLAADYRIVLLVGDSLEDFTEGFKAPAGERKELAEALSERWGRQWIMLPNPMYGHWEAAFYNFDYDMDRSDRLARKVRGLVP